MQNLLRLWSAPLAALVLVVFPVSRDEVLAPDGQRGLGAELTLQEFHALVRSDEPEDVAFLGGLYALAGEIQIQIALVRDQYRGRGYLALLERGTDESIANLHDAYLRARQDPLPVLERGKKSGRAFAHMLCDTRFNVRLELLILVRKEEVFVFEFIQLLQRSRTQQ